jgi:hypothetical protein
LIVEYNRHFEGKYLCKYLALVDIIVTYTKYRKIDGKMGFLISRKIIFFGNIPVCSQQKCLTLKSIQLPFYADRYIIIKYRCSLLPSPPQFRQLKFEAVTNSHLIPKDTNLHQQRCTNTNCRKPTLYCTCQFQTLAQISTDAAHLTGNVELTENLNSASSTWPAIHMSCYAHAPAALSTVKTDSTY